MAISDEEQFSVEKTSPTMGNGEASQLEVSASDAQRGGGAGGAAMAGGQRFQAQVTAWWGARVLRR